MSNRANGLAEIIKSRRSVRVFNEKMVSSETVHQMIESARWAPCPNNYQPWKFVVARKNSAVTNSVVGYLKKKVQMKNIAVSVFLKDAIRVLENANVSLYVFNTGNMKSRYKKIVNKYYQQKAYLFEHQAIAAAIQNVLLVAEASGVGTVWLGSPVMVNVGIQRLLGWRDELCAIIAMGYYDRLPHQTKRLSVEDISCFAK